MLGQIYLYFFSWMPLSLQIVLLAFVSLMGIVFIFRVVALVIDAIPLL